MNKVELKEKINEVLLQLADEIKYDIEIKDFANCCGNMKAIELLMNVMSYINIAERDE